MNKSKVLVQKLNSDVEAVLFEILTFESSVVRAYNSSKPTWGRFK